MGAGEKGHTGSTATQCSQARSPRMEPLDVGSPSPWESTQLFYILLRTRRGSGLKWQGAGSGGEDRQPSWLRGRFLLPKSVRGLLPHRWEHGERVTPTPRIVSTQKDTTGSLRPPRPGALLGECECTRGAQSQGRVGGHGAPSTTAA